MASEKLPERISGSSGDTSNFAENGDTEGEQTAIPEADWARNLGKTPEWVTSVLLATGGLPLAFSTFTDGWWHLVPYGLSAFLVLVGTTLSILRHERNKRVAAFADERLETLRSDLDDHYGDIIDTMNVAVYQVVHAKIATTPKTLTEQMLVVQTTVLSLVRSYLGPKSGVRANLFTPDPQEPETLIAAPWGFQGNTTPSERRFRQGDKSFDLAMIKREWLVKDTDDLPWEDRPEKGTYRTFATYPVGNNEGLFGILTVDAKNPGDLTDFDVVMLGFFAGILALTFEDQKGAPSIPRHPRGTLCKNEVTDHPLEGEEDD